ncbi:MAG: hypothetical protein IPM74_01785 [Crocinitomicaceae bacterium]|nr:hypothetical protein [Crocinitomicaceae bacterium]MBK8924646.1 hypothetical protein [Crocinitomicaceae bacterium]
MPSYKFRVLIDTTDGADIFRDILISTSDTLETFYDTIMKAFDFKGDQMASFYKSNEDWDKGQEITLLDMGFSESGEPVLLMSETKLKDVVTEADQRLILVYDFMRMWCFLIELVGTQPKAVAKPQVLLSIGKSPAEDSKSLDAGAGFQSGETLDLGSDFDDIFSGENDDDDEFGDDFDPEDFKDEGTETDFY